MRILEEVNRELIDVQDQLLALADDDFAEKYRLQVLRDELREQASRFRVGFDLDRSDEALLQEHAARRSQIDPINKLRVDSVTQAGGRSAAGTGASHADQAAINHGIADAQGIGKINARIARLESILDGRGVEYPTQ